MEFLEFSSVTKMKDKAMANILASLDGLTIGQAESILIMHQLRSSKQNSM